MLMLALIACNLQLPFGSQQDTEEEAESGPAGSGGDAGTDQPQVQARPTVDVSTLPPTTPQVVAQTPFPGEELPSGGTIDIYFDQPMNQSTVEAALTFSGNVDYATEWPDDSTLRVIPSSGELNRAANYVITIGPDAESLEGLSLGQAVDVPIQTLGFLEVGEVLPSGEAASTDSAITLLFNRPIVTLGEDLDLPLSFSPQVSGEGEWLNTSIYRFTPDSPLAGGQQYTVTLADAVTAQDGADLQQPYSWQFTTVPPNIVSVFPEAEQAFVGLNENVQIEFNQPMDQLSVQNAFSIQPVTGQTVEGRYNWSEDGQTMTFTPAPGFSYGQLYVATITTDAQSSGGAPIGQEVAWQFSSVQVPAVTRTDPLDGSGGVAPRGVNIYVSAPLDFNSVTPDLITAIPELPDPDTVAYNEQGFGEFAISIYSRLEPSTQYTITLEPGAADPYGTEIEQPYTFTFTTAPAPADFFLNNFAGRVGLFRASQDIELAVTYSNVSTLDFELSTVSLPAFTETLQGGAPVPFTPGSIDREWSIQTEPTQNQTAEVLVPIPNQETEPLPKGIYALRISSPTNPEVEAGVYYLVITDTHITYKRSYDQVFVWVNDLDSGQPLSGETVTFYDRLFNEIGSGTTGPDGVLQLDVEPEVELFGQSYAIVDSGSRFGISSTDWGSESISPWNFGVPANYFIDPFTAYIYTDRPLYRPGQEVFFRGVLRELGGEDNLYKLPGPAEVPYEVRGPGGVSLLTDTLVIDEYGTFDGSISLDEEADFGYYEISVGIDDNNYNSGFDVLEYRPPEFFLDVTPTTEEIISGESADLEVSGEFFFGGPVSNTDVSWFTYASPYIFDRYEGEGYYSFTDFDPQEAFDFNPFFSGFDSRDLDGSGTTDSDGAYTLETPIDISDVLVSQRVMFDITLYDDVRSSTENVAVIVHKGEYYVGVQPENYIGEAGTEQTINLIVVDWQGNPVPRTTIEVEFFEQEWTTTLVEEPFGIRYFNYELEETPVGDPETVRTGADGTATIPFTPPNGGNFRIRAIIDDPSGSEVSASASMWVTSRGVTAWRPRDRNRLFLITDRDIYQPGDTAEVLIPSPFEGGDVQALITIERSGILQHDVVDVPGSSLVYEVPITANYAPNIFVSVVLYRAADADTPPAFRYGIVQLDVDPVQQTLNLTLTPDRDIVGPGDEVTYTIETTNYAGQPTDAEVSLSLVDKAIFELANFNYGTLLDRFYNLIPLSVVTGVPLDLLVENLQLPPVGGGGGGGGGREPFIREEFEDTAYWTANLRTGEDGVEQVTIQLPDNLTTWQMDARAVTPDTLLGEATVDIVATRPLLIRPQTPRFFVSGDEVTLSAVVNNNTDERLRGAVMINASGVRLIGDATQSIDIRPGERIEFDWPAVVEDDATFVNLTFGVEAGDYSDASRPPLGDPDNDQRLPVYRFEAPATVGTSGQLADAGTRLEGVVLPPTYENIQQAQVDVTIDPSLASAALDGLKWLEDYPFSSTEATVSRFLPNALTIQTLREFGIDDPELEAKLDTSVNQALQKLYGEQDVDGGWGWSTEAPSDPYITAYVVQGLVAAREAGYPISDEVLGMALNYLRSQLDQLSTVSAQYVLGRQAYVLYVLALADEPDLQRTESQFEARGNLPIYGQALLAQALWTIDPTDPRLDDLQSDLVSEASISASGAHWQEESNERINWSTDTRTSAIVLDTLSLVWPETDLMPNAARWLMTAREADHWSTTQETTWALIAINHYLAATGELDAGYTWSFDFNGQEVGSGTADESTLADSSDFTIPFSDIVTSGVNRMAFERSEGSGNMYYTANLTTYLPADQIDAESRGIIISREYFNENGTRVQQARVGEVITVVLNVIAPNDLNYVVIEDYYPAGAEAVNPDLLNESALAQAPTIRIETGLDDFGEPMYRYGFGAANFDADLRAERAVLLSDGLPPGSYQYVYQLRLLTVGRFNVIPPTAREVYFPDVYGRGQGTQFTILPE